MYKSKRIGKIVICIVVATAILAGAGFWLQEKYKIRNVYVEGNVHYSKEEIEQMVTGGFLGNNSLYLSLKYRNRGISGIPFVDVMDVNIISADTIRITVYEKTLTGYVNYLGACMYFDKDGYVVESSSVKTQGVPEITGLQFDHVVVGEKLPVENDHVFEQILSITKLLRKFDLNSDKIYFNKNGEIVLHFGQTKVELGNNPATLEDRLMLLPELLTSLDGKKGTLFMTEYTEAGGRYTFKPEE